MNHNKIDKCRVFFELSTTRFYKIIGHKIGLNGLYARNKEPWNPAYR